MKPHTVNQITVRGKDRNAAQYLHDLQVTIMRLHIRDYLDAGAAVPDAVKEQARKLGVEVEA